MKLVMGLVKGKDGTREGMREEIGWERRLFSCLTEVVVFLGLLLRDTGTS